MRKVLVVGLLAVAGVAAGCSSETKDMPGVARQACHDFVRQQITVSDFESAADTKITTGTGGEWTVAGQAATSSGPRRYTCSMRSEAAADQWRLLNLTGV